MQTARALLRHPQTPQAQVSQVPHMRAFPVICRPLRSYYVSYGCTSRTGINPAPPAVTVPPVPEPPPPAPVLPPLPHEPPVADPQLETLTTTAQMKSSLFPLVWPAQLKPFLLASNSMNICIYPTTVTVFLPGLIEPFGASYTGTVTSESLWVICAPVESTPAVTSGLLLPAVMGNGTVPPVVVMTSWPCPKPSPLA